MTGDRADLDLDGAGLAVARSASSTSSRCGRRGSARRSWRRGGARATPRSPPTGSSCSTSATPTWTPRSPAAPSRCCGRCASSSTGSRCQHRAHRPGRRGAQPAHRGRRPWSATSTGCTWRPASATPRRSSAPTASAPRSRPAGRCTSSGTSTTRRTSRTWPAPACPIRHPISGKTVGGARPDLLAAGRRPAAGHAGQDDRRADPAGPADRDRRPRDRADARLPAGLPAQHGHGVRAQQRRRHDERDGPDDARRRRPVGAAAARRRGAGRAPRVGDRRAAVRRAACGCTAGRCAPRAGWPAAWSTSAWSSAPTAQRRPRAARRMLLPGLIGHRRRSGGGPAARSRRCTGAGEWLVLEGEPGTGKLALLRALHQRVNPAGHFSVLDGAEARRRPTRAGWPRPGAASPRRGHGRAAAPRAAARADAAGADRARCRTRRGAPSAWVAVAVTAGAARPRAGRGCCGCSPARCRLPPLRHHVEDVEQLVPFFLLRLGHGGQLTCSPEAMQLLLRARWPGNVEQVLEVLRAVLRHRRSGTIQPATCRRRSSR